MTTSPQETFRQMLLNVMGQVFTAAGYALDEAPLQWQSGQFRFRQTADPTLAITYQLLIHPEMPDRFTIRLQRGPQTVSLPRLLWDDFAVHVLPAPDHWWAYNDVVALSDGLLESGKLLAGYGLPWLAGTLHPGQDSAG